MDKLDNGSTLRALLDQIPGGIGIYHIYADGRPEMVYLNNGYYEMIGSSREERERFSGFNVMLAVPEERREKIMALIQKAVEGDGRFAFTVPNQGPGETRWMRLSGQIVERRPDRSVAYVSYTDVTDYEITVRQLEEVQAEIQIATDRVGILYWLYKTDKHQSVITRGKGYGYDTVIDNVPECFRGTGDIHPEDEPVYFHLFEQMKEGVDSCEGYARVFNHALQIYQWQHIVFTRLSENRYVGSSIDVTEQKRAEQQYHAEISLRHELLKDSVISYQLNLTKGIVEEKASKQRPPSGKKAPFAMTDADWQWALSQIPDEASRREFARLFSFSSLLKAWESGITSVTMPGFPLKLSSQTRWFSSRVTMTKRPETGDIIAITYTNDINDATHNRLAIHRALAEEMEFIALIDARSEKIRLVSASDELRGVPPEAATDFLTYRDGVIAPLVVEEDREAFLAGYTVPEMRRALENGSAFLLNYRKRRPDGGIRRKQLRAFYLDDSRELIVLSRRDITDLYEEERRQAATLQKALDEAKAANAAKTSFLSQMSHDMRTPMNGILGLAALMRDTEDLDELRQDIDQLSLSGHYLLNLINDTLDINKIEAGKLELHLKPMNSENVFSNLLSTATLMAREHNVQLDVKIPHLGHGRWLPVLADAPRLEQIFMNVLSNAIKYTPEGGKVEVVMESLLITDTEVRDRYTIRDNGIGMSPDFLPHIFDTFSQEGRVHTERQNGTGLGMAIVKRLVDMMGGTISIQSELNVGTEVVICLRYPVYHPTAKSNDQPEPPADLSLLKGQKVLLCEDHPLNRKIAAQLLEKAGVEVVCASDGKAGVEAFAASAPNELAAVLMDVRMPVMDGLTATRAIRALERADARRVPIIAMTANAFDEDVQNCLNAGMNAHLGKPFEVDTLYHVLAQQIANSARDAQPAQAAVPPCFSTDPTTGGRA